MQTEYVKMIQNSVGKLLKEGGNVKTPQNQSNLSIMKGKHKWNTKYISTQRTLKLGQAINNPLNTAQNVRIGYLTVILWSISSVGISQRKLKSMIGSGFDSDFIFPSTFWLWRSSEASNCLRKSIKRTSFSYLTKSFGISTFFLSGKDYHECAKVYRKGTKFKGLCRMNIKEPTLRRTSPYNNQKMRPYLLLTSNKTIKQNQEHRKKSNGNKKQTSHPTSECVNELGECLKRKIIKNLGQKQVN